MHNVYSLDRKLSEVPKITLRLNNSLEGLIESQKSYYTNS